MVHSEEDYNAAVEASQILFGNATADTLAKLIGKQVMRGQDIGDGDMLKTYAKRRKADQKRVEIFCDTVVYSFMIQNPLLKVARNVGLIAFDKVPFVKPMVATFAMGLKS